MKKRVLLVAFALGSSFMTAANANNYNVRNSNGASCSQTESTGKSFELGTTYDSYNDDVTLSATWKFELGKQKLRGVNCNRLYDVSIKREQLELDKAYLELQLLRAQIAAVKNNKEAPKSTGDDW